MLIRAISESLFAYIRNHNQRYAIRYPSLFHPQQNRFQYKQWGFTGHLFRDNIIYTHSICPSGWHLPTQSEFADLSSALDDDPSAFMEAPNRFGLTGYFAPSTGMDFQGDNGYWWSSTAINEGAAYNLMVRDRDYYNSVNPDNGYEEYYGLAVRCLAD